MEWGNRGRDRVGIERLASPSPSITLSSQKWCHWMARPYLEPALLGSRVSLHFRQVTLC